MQQHGTHAAYQERELRGRAWLWNGAEPTKAPVATFRDLSFHNPFAAFGISIATNTGGNITTGFKGYREVPFDCTIEGVDVVGDAAGSIVFDIYKSTYAAFPPQPADTMTPLAASRPQLVNAQVYRDHALHGWTTTTLTRGEMLGFAVLGAEGLRSVVLSLLVRPNARL